MATAKDIVIKQIDSTTANELVRRLHYSGKVAQNSQLHLGVFLDGRLEGAMQFGPSLDKRKIQGLVSGTQWHEFLELNRMAFSEALPRNSESRALGIAMRLMKKYAPQVKWIISFADGTQCGDGTIYRASGFVLTAVKENDRLYLMPNGKIAHGINMCHSNLSDAVISNGWKQNDNERTFTQRVSARLLLGFQLRYIYFIDPAYRARLTVPELPYSEIERRGAKMYKGQRPGGTGEIDNAARSNAQTGGASPTVPLLIQRENKENG